MSVDTDQWVVAFFYYAMAQGEAGSTRIVVRGQKGVYRWQGGSCIDAPKLNTSIVAPQLWLSHFSAVAINLPLVAAFVLSSSDFTSPLNSLTALHMVNSYRDLVGGAHNWPFVLPLSTNPEGSVGVFEPDLPE